MDKAITTDRPMPAGVRRFLKHRERNAVVKTAIHIWPMQACAGRLIFASSRLLAITWIYQGQLNRLGRPSR